MKFAVSVVFVIVALATIVYAVPRPEEDTYPTKYDNIDLDSILTNERLLNSYIECIQDKGKCTPEGEELKKHIKGAIQECCKKCSEKQKEGVKKVFAHFETNKPDVLKGLKEKHDPKGEFEAKCADLLKA